MVNPNDPVRGGMTPEMRVLGPILDAYQIIEDALTEIGVTGPSTNPELNFNSRAEQVAKAIVARLANNDPPILLYYADEKERS